MKNKFRFIGFAVFFIGFAHFFMFGQDNVPDTSDYAVESDLVEGIEAYKNKQWADSLFFLKKAIINPANSTEEVWYLLINAEFHLKEYEGVVRDAEIFATKFPKSPYSAEVFFQLNLAYFVLEHYVAAAQGFKDFLEKYPRHAFVPAALFWQAEASYNAYDFTNAQLLYEKIIHDFPQSSQYSQAVYKLELLKQREREEKLLYLLRVTGEEAIAAKEDYQRQLRQLKSEENITLRQQLQEMERKNQELTLELSTSAQNEADLNTIIVSLKQKNFNLQEKVSELEKELFRTTEQTGKETVATQNAPSKTENDTVKKTENDTVKKTDSVTPQKPTEQSPLATLNNQEDNENDDSVKKAEDNQAKPVDSDVQEDERTRLLRELREKAERLQNIVTRDEEEK